MVPLQLLGSQCWKITLPTGSAGKPTEVLMPALASYADDLFRVNGAGTGVVLVAPTNGVTTSGSKYPRCELREMWPDGLTKAAWSMDGSHTLEVELSVDALPVAKPHIVVAQIHDASDDVCVWRVEGSRNSDAATLWVTDGNNSHAYKVGLMRLGERFRVAFHVYAGTIRFLHNDNLLPYTQTKSATDCYFKVGAYVQCNTPTILAGGRVDFGQVTVYGLRICHDGVCQGGAPVATDEVAQLRADLTALQVAFTSYVVANETRFDRVKAAMNAN